MSSLPHLLQGPSTIKRRVPTIKKIVQKGPPSPPHPKPSIPTIKHSDSEAAQRNGATSGKNLNATVKTASWHLPKTAAPQRTGLEKRRRHSPAQQQLLLLLESNSEGSSDEGDFLEARKRAKTSVSAEPDVNRRVRSLQAFSEEDGGIFDMIHAADIASLDLPDFQPAFNGTFDSTLLLLQYPSASQQER